MSIQLKSKAVAFRDIGSGVCAYIVDLAGEDQLIAVVHIIYVCLHATFLTAKYITNFQVAQRFMFRCLQQTYFKIIPVRFFVADGIRSIEMLLPVQLESKTTFWIEEIIQV